MKKENLVTTTAAVSNENENPCDNRIVVDLDRFLLYAAFRNELTNLKLNEKPN